ncbi:MAG TPA: hypothetical protein PLL20_06600 [Phycisphaerae bacterium]|nr:hypothetical protein [Phycisphaerae bacterium]HRR85554.1 hypothetical protein [Phycisphaerae bacterium]
MKAVLVLIVLAVVVIGLVYKFGGYASFDPTAQGREAKGKIQPGMTVKQVVDIAGPNGKFHNISVLKQKIRGQDVVKTVRGPAMSLNPDQLNARIQRNELPNGFTIEYVFSQQAAFEVIFDSTGKVTGIENVTTMADLLNSRED